VTFSEREKLQAVAFAVSAHNPYGLNAGEFNVARMLGRGLGLAEIAETLGMTGRSVLAHRDRLMQKLHARNQAHLEHIIATLIGVDYDWSESVYLDDLSDDQPEVASVD
jgi:DNA-binding CsgD family transcriptional regulator